MIAFTGKLLCRSYTLAVAQSASISPVPERRAESRNVLCKVPARGVPADKTVNRRSNLCRQGIHLYIDFVIAVRSSNGS